MDTSYEPSPISHEIDWADAMKNRFLKNPGEHLLEIGITGSGKTQGLYHILNGILDYSKSETILWITCGKSAEELKLMQFGKTHYLFPTRRGIAIDLYEETYPYTSYEFTSIADIFRHINKGTINILCLAPYFPDPEDYSLVITEFFKNLIVLARKGVIPTPLAIFIDEFQMVAPARGQALNEQHGIGGRWMQRNLDQLRSMGIRIVAAAQSWRRVLQGVRTSFSCIMIRQGAEFNNDIPRLMAQNDKWQALGKKEMVFAFRNRFYSDVQTLPSYGDGEIIGRIEFTDSTNRQIVSELSIDDLLDSYKKKPTGHPKQEAEAE
jgi:energy-coupling factor transporter ATP-binding protein EcfA2